SRGGPGPGARTGLRRRTARSGGGGGPGPPPRPAYELVRRKVSPHLRRCRAGAGGGRSGSRVSPTSSPSRRVSVRVAAHPPCDRRHGPARTDPAAWRLLTTVLTLR